MEETEIPPFRIALRSYRDYLGRTEHVPANSLPLVHPCRPHCRHNLSDNAILSGKKTSQTPAHQKRIINPFNCVGTVRHPWDLPLCPRQPASSSSNLARLWMGSGIPCRFDNVLLNVVRRS